MKKLLLLLAFPILWSCEGDRGPMGPPGLDGTNILGQTFEYENVDFNYDFNANLFTRILDIPPEIAIEPSDAILVYRLEIQNVNGNSVETWSLIPQNFFLPEGTIQYVYNHTDLDVELLIDGNFDLSNLDFGFTDNQVFRFVVLPSDFANDPKKDLSTYNQLTQALESEKLSLKEF